MAEELACEKCGKTWRVQVPPQLIVKVESCPECGKFKFCLEPVARVPQESAGRHYAMSKPTLVE